MTPILDEHALDIISHSVLQTRRLGARLAALLQPGDVICLEGELGSGKTVFVQGVGQGLGIEEPITSPSFVIVSEYRPRPPAPPLYHVDLYRLGEAALEAASLGLDDYLYGDGICLIEWADRAWELMPAERLWIQFRHLHQEPYKRGLLFQASGLRYQQMLEEFKRSAFGV